MIDNFDLNNTYSDVKSSVLYKYSESRKKIFKVNETDCILFDNIEETICNIINKTKRKLLESNKSIFIVGAMYKFTSNDLCSLLNTIVCDNVNYCSIIINKPGVKQAKQSSNNILDFSDRYTIRAYNLKLNECGDILFDVFNDEYLQSVRVFGIGPFNQYIKYKPIMHHKFLVICCYDYEKHTINPISSIIGSYNYTFSANSNIENIIYSENKNIAKRYYDEWQYLYTGSERIGNHSQDFSPECCNFYNDNMMEVA